jgi:hypothetical protein
LVINLALLVALVGILISYTSVISTLPEQIYSSTELAFIQSNVLRRVSQMAPMLNVIGADGLMESALLPWRVSKVRARLLAHLEKEEDVSAALYDLEFEGEYQFVPPGTALGTVEIFFPFPQNLETLHEVQFLVDGEEPPGVVFSTQGIRWTSPIGDEEEHRISVRYHAQGANTFTYVLPQEQRSDLDVSVTIEGLRGSSVLDSSLPTTARELEEGGEIFQWHYTNLIADRNIQIELPIQPSFSQRLASLQGSFRDLARLAPISIALTLFSLAGALHLTGARVRLEQYLLVGCGLALFYPLLTYLSGWIGLPAAAPLSLTLVTAMLTAFLGVTLGWKTVGVRATLIFLIFMGLFSLGTLSSYRGILLAGGGVLLLGIFMVLYARRPIMEDIEKGEGVEEISPAVDPPPELDEAEAKPAGFFCPYCAQVLEEAYHFCPACGQDASQIRRCAQCGCEQLIPTGHEEIYCLHCGEKLERQGG